MATRWSRSAPIFMLWLIKIWQVSSCGKFTQHLESCLLWQLKLTEFCVNFLMFWTVFFHWMYKMKYGCYQESSVIHGWFVDWLFGWVMCRCQSRRNPISDGIVFVFQLAWCVRGFKSLKQYLPYLIAFRSCISNGKPEWSLYLMFVFLSLISWSRAQFMRQVYARL